MQRRSNYYSHYHLTLGFTLLEIMVVVVILGILAALVAPQVIRRIDDAQITKVKQDIRAFETALNLFRLDNFKYPTTEQGLSALLTEPTASPVPTQWSGPYLKKKKIPKDPWNRDYVYASPGVHNPESYDLSSLGATGVEGSDNVNNWENESK